MGRPLIVTWLVSAAAVLAAAAPASAESPHMAAWQFNVPHVSFEECQEQAPIALRAEGS